VSLLAGIVEPGKLLGFMDVATQEDTGDLLNRIRADLHPGQLAFVDDTATEIIGISAGYGAGKTRALCAKAVMLAAANQGFIGAVMEPTGPLIRDIWQNDFEQFLEAYEIPYTFRASPLPEYMLHLPGGDTKILCRSFENWSRIIGLNLAWVLADEIDTVTPSIANKAFPKILGRLRSGNVRQFGAASTPEGFRWMWNTFGSEDAKGRNDRKLIKMRSADNPHLPPDFIERLQANYDPNLLRAYLDGEFVNLTTGTIYDRFSREKHVVAELPDLDREPLRIGVDFNVGNMSAVIGVRTGSSLLVIDEISGAHDTDALAQEIQARYPQRRIYIYPDAATAAPMQARPISRSWSLTACQTSRRAQILPSVIGWLLFRLCWKTARVRFGSLFTKAASG
jgi:hypothetical protein